MTDITLTHEEKAKDSTTLLGFWTYLMTDFVLFAGLFATYAVLRTNTFGGPSGAQLFDPPFFLAETLLLLTSSFTCGLGILAARAGNVKAVLAAFGATFVLGAAFLVMELSEFSQFIAMGDGPSRSAFLSSYFTLVGTHGLHVALGLLWMLMLMTRIYFLGLTRSNSRKLILFSLFWHFLDIIWIFIFTIVYLYGVV